MPPLEPFPPLIPCTPAVPSGPGVPAGPYKHPGFSNHHKLLIVIDEYLNKKPARFHFVTLMLVCACEGSGVYAVIEVYDSPVHHVVHPLP